ncbi:MAG: hypothetical protein R3E10_03420 [Gemmatimonadota bacterium]
MGAPSELRVETDQAGGPLRIRRPQGRAEVVAHIRESWRIDDEWWRAPISRLYYEVVLENGRSLTLFHDRIARRWFAH